LNDRSEEQENTLNNLLHAEFEVVQALKLAGKARVKSRRIVSEAKKKRVREAFDLVDLLVMSGVIDGKTLSFHRGVDKNLLVGHLSEVFNNKPADYISSARSSGSKVIAARVAEREKKKAERLAIIQQGKQERADLRKKLA